ncbi:MAG: hypothetical protein EON53_13345 [Actinomycetales bacterium]|nr:MAG: hypothetical protein EON53_13345 [Actinomycetales bacterium]
MRPLAAAVSALVLGAVLVAVPTSAQADDPDVRVSGDSTVYTDPALDDEDTTRIRGVLRGVVVEHDPSDPSTSVRPESVEPVVVTADGLHVPVSFDVEEVAPAGSPVVAELVDGPALDSALAGEPEQPVEVATASFTTASAATTVPHRAYLAIVANSDSSVAATATVESRLATGLQWWATESGVSFTRAATSRYSSGLAAGGTRCGLGSPNALWNEAAQRFPTVDFRAPGNHLVVVVGDDCDGTGIGTLGGSMSDGGAVTLTESAGVFTATIAHEVGHNVGLEHANLGAVEYWDLYSPMGLAVQGTGTTALDSEYRDELGLAGAGEIVVVPSGTSTTRTLSARGGSTGLRGLEVRSGGTSHWVEWRPGTGRDAQGYYPLEAQGTWVSRTRTYPMGVTVSTRATGTSGPTSLRPRTADGVEHGAWRVGQTYTSGAVTVRVDQVSAAGATVTVANGATVPPPAAPLPLTAATPTVSGTPKVGVKLTAVPGTWTTGTTFAYQWYVNGAAIASARSAAYTPTAGARGKRLTVRVTGSRAGHVTTSRTSAATRTVAYGTLRTSAPRISGTVKVGRKLTLVRGTWTSGTTFSYRWYVNGTAIKGATRSSYTLTKGTKGKRITVKVTGRRTGYTTVTRTSARTSVVR